MNKLIVGQGFHQFPMITDVLIPSASILKFDRIYMNKNSPDYNSITFILVDSPNRDLVTKPKPRPRFWVKLEDANNIEYEVFEP